MLQDNLSQVHPSISPCPSPFPNFAKSLISSQCFSNPLSFNVIKLFQYVLPSTTSVPFFKEFNLKTHNVIDFLQKMKKFLRYRSEIWSINFDTFKIVQVTLLLWTDYKQVENYKTRQVLLIHQLVLIC
jgi:hypothetical protein